MAVALASAADLCELLGIPVPDDDSLPRKRMDLILQLASDWARDFARKAWIDPDDAPTTVRGIVLTSARREWNNPKRVADESIGPEGHSYIRSAYPDGFFSEAEVKWFRKFHKTGSLFTISTSRDSEEESLGYLEISDVGGWLPMFHPSDPGWESSFRL